MGSDVFACNVKCGRKDWRELGWRGEGGSHVRAASGSAWKEGQFDYTGTPAVRLFVASCRPLSCCPCCLAHPVSKPGVCAPCSLLITSRPSLCWSIPWSYWILASHAVTWPLPIKVCHAWPPAQALAAKCRQTSQQCGSLYCCILGLCARYCPCT